MAALAKHQKIKEPFCFQRQHWAWNGRLPPAALLPSRLERFWTSFHQHQRVGLGWFLRALVLHAEAAAGTHDPLGRFRVPFSVFFFVFSDPRVWRTWRGVGPQAVGFGHVGLGLKIGFYCVLLGCSGVLLGFTWSYRHFTGFHLVVRGFTEFYLVLLGFTEF